MRKIFSVATILAAFALLAGCSGAGADDPGVSFEGTWRHTSPWAENAVYTFKDDTWRFERDNNDPLSGTFSFSDSEITFTPNEEDPAPWTQTYEFKGKTLVLDLVTGHFYGPFEKKPASDKGKWAGAGVCLISKADLEVYLDSAHDEKQAKPTGIAYVGTGAIRNNAPEFSADFKEPHNANTDDVNDKDGEPYSETLCNGRWYISIDAEGTPTDGNISVPAGNYYACLIPRWLPTGSVNGGFYWMYDSAQMYAPGSENKALLMIDPENPFPFMREHFKNRNEVSLPE